MASIVLDRVMKKFGNLTVVDDISMSITNGEFFTLLGPSGCGKTTLLRMMAGFLFPDSGDIRFADQSIIQTPAHKRQTGMVFQNYALFPHMTVFENVAYGLKARNAGNAEVKSRVEAMLETVHLRELAARYPRQLSGGQQQRVALARAMVIEPLVLLMDEPLSNLDAKLRVNMREEIRRIQKQSGITTVYVTHDQEEAMAISDRIAILSEGKMQQIGSPWDIYCRPVNSFAAQFMGACSLFAVTPTGRDGDMVVGEIAGIPLRFLGKDFTPNAPFTVMLRPDWIKEADGNACLMAPTNRFPGTVRESVFLGAAVSYVVEALGQHIRVDLPAPAQNAFKQPGDAIELFFEPDRPVAVSRWFP